MSAPSGPGRPSVTTLDVACHRCGRHEPLVAEGHWPHTRTTVESSCASQTTTPEAPARRLPVVQAAQGRARAEVAPTGSAQSTAVTGLGGRQGLTCRLAVPQALRVYAVGELTNGFRRLFLDNCASRSTVGRRSGSSGSLRADWSSARRIRGRSTIPLRSSRNGAGKRSTSAPSTARAAAARRTISL